MVLWVRKIVQCVRYLPGLHSWVKLSSILLTIYTILWALLGVILNTEPGVTPDHFWVCPLQKWLCCLPYFCYWWVEQIFMFIGNLYFSLVNWLLLSLFILCFIFRLHPAVLRGQWNGTSLCQNGTSLCFPHAQDVFSPHPQQISFYYFVKMFLFNAECICIYLYIYMYYVYIYNICSLSYMFRFNNFKVLFFFLPHLAVLKDYWCLGTIWNPGSWIWVGSIQGYLPAFLSLHPKSINS